MSEAVPEMADRVRRTVNERGMSQRALAAAMDLEASKLSKSLRGHRRLTALELKRLAAALGVSVDWLLSGRDTVPAVAVPPEPTVLPADLYSGRRGDTRRQIVEAAWLLIGERGYHNVRVRDVADKCGISSAAVHYHFTNRRELLAEALRVSVRNAYDRQEAELDRIPDAHDRLLQLIELQLPKPGLMRLEWSIWLQVWNESTFDPQIRDLHAAAYSRWHSTVRAAIEFGQARQVFITTDANELTLRLTALIDGLGLQVITGRPGSTVAAMRDRLHDFVRAEIVLAPEDTDHDGMESRP